MLKNYLLLNSLIFLIISCNSNEAKKINSDSFKEAIISVSDAEKIDHAIPNEKRIEKFDTIISNKNIQITIIKNDLDSYVVIENIDDENNKYFNKYRDAEINLIIKQNSKKILDTIFRKNQFSNFIDEDFSNVAIFHNYWFEKAQDDKLQFFRTLNKPDTDYSFSFYHYFDLKSNQLKLIELTEEEN